MVALIAIHEGIFDYWCLSSQHVQIDIKIALTFIGETLILQLKSRYVLLHLMGIIIK